MDTKQYLQEIEAVIKAGPYHDNWQSLSQYQVPKWYKDAKFGIFIHWGPLPYQSLARSIPIMSTALPGRQLGFP